MFNALKEKIKPLMIDRAARRMALGALVFNLLAWALLLFRLFPLLGGKRVVGLHYNVYLKVTEVGTAGWALVPAIMGTVILAANLALGARLYRMSRQNALILLAVTFFYEMLLLAVSFFLVLINLSR